VSCMEEIYTRATADTKTGINEALNVL
jgi:hypothetical protein